MHIAKPDRTSRSLGLVMLLGAFGCQTTVTPADTTADVPLLDGIVVIADGDASSSDGLGDVGTPSPQDISLDFASGDAQGDAPDGCESGGCFGDPCETNDDCFSSLCGQHMGEAVCTKPCQDDCPAGWSCQQVDLGGSDPIYMCVSTAEHLCNPCLEADSCSSASTDAACVDYGAQGLFCGAVCAIDADCPVGFICAQSESTRGGTSAQCVLESGECPCSSKAVSLGLATRCTVENELGTCEGLRTCTQDGLGACDASTPTEEVCDGVDNDCDGDTDEATCPNDNVCVSATCGGAGGCVYENLVGTDCDDSDACTQNDACLDGACAGTPVDCEDQNVCTDNACDSVTGCTTENNTAECDDGSVCTSIDTCFEGSCIGGGVPDCDDGNPCTTATCDTDTGCDYIPNPSASDDDDPSTTIDVCEASACVGKAPDDCDDDDQCTDDVCVEGEGCEHNFNVAPCDDLEPCTTVDACSQGTCVGAVEPNCDDGNPCTQDLCELGVGCTHPPIALVCNDSNACTLVDQCIGGQCVGSSNVQCPLGQACDTDSGCVDKSVIWAHSPSTLYRIDLAQLEVDIVGSFDLGGEQMTDIAEAQDGTLYGISFSNLFIIDKETGQATMVAALNGLVGLVNGLTVAPDGTLYAGSSSGSLFVVNGNTGDVTLAGAVGAGMTSSGDIVWGPLSVIYVSDPNGITDQLLSVNPFTGGATPIGDIGFGMVYGLSFANGGLIGVNHDGEVIQINYLTGAGSGLMDTGLIFWGGG